MRLIDADALEETFRKTYKINGKGVICAVIDEAPTVEAEPIKHGYWHILNDTDMNAVCSVCGNDTMLYYGSVVMDFEYCPCCGAKMNMARKRAVKNEKKNYIF